MPHTTVCSGELPIVHHTHAYLIHIIGCAISPFTSELELVLTVDRPTDFVQLYGLDVDKLSGLPLASLESTDSSAPSSVRIVLP